MIRAEEARELARQADEIAAQKRAEKAAHFCVTEIEPTIKLNAQNGFRNVGEIEIPTTVSLNLVKNILTANGFTVTTNGTGHKIGISW